MEKSLRVRVSLCPLVCPWQTNPVYSSVFETMPLSKKVKFIVFVPTSHAEKVRMTLGDIGAGQIGNYEHCSFSTLGTGRFRGNASSNPAIGTAGVLEAIEEERIEVVMPEDLVKEAVDKVKSVHPYEEVAFDIYPLLSIE